MSTPPKGISSHYLSTWPRQAIEMARIAFELTSEEWPKTGQGAFHPTIANGCDYSNIVEEIAHRMVALLVIRLVALLTCRLGNQCHVRQTKIYADFSTSTICRTVLTHVRQQAAKNQDWESYDPSSFPSNSDDQTSSSSIQGPPFPAALTPKIFDQLHAYTLAICQGYHPSIEVPYHNVEHAYHVFLSANKLLDLMLCEGEAVVIQVKGPKMKRPTYGIKCDPLAQFAFLFSALIHDVDHTGISNRQLVLESDYLAVLYNDQSVAEQRSLAVAFTTLNQPEYEELRDVIFKSIQKHGKTDASSEVAPFTDGDDFFRFRKLVIGLVLATDIASPERTQIVKSKWKEAFGEAAQIQILEKKTGSDPENKNEKNVNFKPEVIRKDEQKLAAINNRLLTDSLVSIASATSAASALSLEEFSDSASSVMSVTDDDDFNQSSASSQKMNFDVVSTGSFKSNGTDKSSDKQSSYGRRRRARTGPHNLSASAVTTVSRKNIRPVGLSRSMVSTSRELKTYRHESRRLGVRRALDLAGSTIEAVSSFKPVLTDADLCMDIEDDVDEFKATTCLEQMLRAADVGALLQDYENVRKWSTRLYKELNNGFYQKRGEDPKNGWFDNQIKFFDFYILPLAKNLGITGVFAEDVGHMFVNCVKCNRSQWIEEGERATNQMIQQDEKERGHRSLLRTSSVSTSDITVTTRNKRASVDSDTKMARTRSLETGEGRECTVCGAADSRFNCPRCTSPYCSALCCREHKTMCVK